MPTDYYSPGVYIEEFDSGPKPIQGVGTSVAAFVGFTERAPDSRPHLVTNWTQFTTTFGGFIPDSYLAYAVRGFFDNGGRQAYVVSVSNSMNGADGQKTRAALAAAAAIPARLPAHGTSLQIEAVSEGKAGEGIQVEIGPATGDGATEEQFKLTVRQPGGKEESFDQLSFGKGRGVRNVEQVVNRESQLIRVKLMVDEAQMSVEKLPQAGLHTLQPAQRPDATGASVGVLGLETVSALRMLCCPDLMSPRVLGDRDGLTRIKSMQLAMLNHCESMKDRFAILDAPRAMGVQDVKEWRTGGAGYDSIYGALYYPWIKVQNQTPPAQRRDGEGERIEVPPSGHVAGVLSRVGWVRGARRPASSVLLAAQDLAIRISGEEEESLSSVGINTIRHLPRLGIRIRRPRSLSSDPAYQYLDLRRLLVALIPNVAPSLRLADSRLAQILGISVPELTAWKDGRALPRPEAGDRLADLGAVQRRLQEIFDPATLHEWLNVSNRYLAGQTPVQVLEQGKVERVEAALEAIESGFFA